MGGANCDKCGNEMKPMRLEPHFFKYYLAEGSPVVTYENVERRLCDRCVKDLDQWINEE